MTTPIPCLDLKRQQQAIKEEVFAAFEKVYEQTAFSGGPFVEKFEKEFAAFAGARHAVGVNNGTTAIQLALKTLGIGAGDEVIVPANTFIATAWGVSHNNATPVFVDCDPATWQIDPACIERAITAKTKAIIGVHLYGMPFDIRRVGEIARKHGLFLIEDAAQAQGAKYDGKVVGTFGEMACFSFYPGKNLGACGEAGGISTENEAYMKHLQSLRNHGCTTRYYHDEIGYNMRMGGLEAASLSVKLKYLEGWNRRRMEIAERYRSEIRNKRIVMQKDVPGAKSIFHLFVVTCDQKDAFVAHLTKHNIVPAFHYPVPCHLQKAYSHLGYKAGDCPNSEYLAAHCVSLPMFAELTDDEVSRVIEAVNNFEG
jgi:dTDP-4-amino-4,6-dideoxygalactose transaminase